MAKVAKSNLTPTERVQRALFAIGIPALTVVGQWLNIGDGSLFVVPVPADAGDGYVIPRPVVQRGNTYTTGIAVVVGEDLYLVGWPRVSIWLGELKTAGRPLRDAPITLEIVKRLGHSVKLTQIGAAA